MFLSSMKGFKVGERGKLEVSQHGTQIYDVS